MATQTVQVVDHKLLAAGKWAATGEWDEVLSPYDGTVVGSTAPPRSPANGSRTWR